MSDLRVRTDAFDVKLIAITKKNVEQLRLMNTASEMFYSDEFYRGVAETRLPEYVKFATTLSGFSVAAVCAHLEPHETVADGFKVQVTVITVLAAYRRRGIGTKLLNHVLDTAKKDLSIIEMCLNVPRLCDVAMQFLLFNGFVRTDLSESGIVMKKCLKDAIPATREVHSEESHVATHQSLNDLSFDFDDGEDDRVVDEDVNYFSKKYEYNVFGKHKAPPAAAESPAPAPTSVPASTQDWMEHIGMTRMVQGVATAGTTARVQNWNDVMQAVSEMVSEHSRRLESIQESVLKQRMEEQEMAGMVDAGHVDSTAPYVVPENAQRTELEEKARLRNAAKKKRLKENQAARRAAEAQAEHEDENLPPLTPLDTKPPSGLVVPPAAPAASLEDDLTCPITLDLMVDPVVAADGTTYERAAIEGWINKARCGSEKAVLSPTTGVELPHYMLIPNRSVQRLIDAYRRKHEL